jgi:hypothetical protein
MMPLTPAEIRRFRRKIGDVGRLVDGQMCYAFPDPDIQDIYEEAGSNFERAVLEAFDELIGNSWKFNDYTQNQTQEKKQQIFSNLLKARDSWYTTHVKSNNQVRIVGIKSVPPRLKDRPDNDALYPLMPDEERDA